MSVLDGLVKTSRERARKIPPRQPEHLPAKNRLLDALRGKDRLKVIAEYKRASPSAGLIAADRDLLAQLQSYQDAGASAVSVLTEPTRFSGSFDDLARASQALTIPTLMKDFIVDPAQIRYAACLGASAVLLIVRCLDAAQLTELVDCAHGYHLSPLVECHDEREVEQAMTLKDVVLGVNNRDLDTLAIDTRRALALLRDIPSDVVVVAESGYECPEDTKPLKGIVDAVLIGSALMRSGDPAGFIRQVCA